MRVILDRSQRSEKYSTADMLIRAGIPVLTDASHAIAHNKVMIIGSDVVVTGSFHFTKAAEERNAENLVMIRGKELAALYVENWRVHLRHSLPLHLGGGRER